VLLLSIAVLCVIAYGIVLVSPAAREQFALTFSRKPIAFSELYFANARNESVVGAGGRPQVAVDFVVVNRTPDPIDYDYRIQVLFEGQQVAEEAGTVTVPSDERRGIYTRVDLAAGRGRWDLVKVSLPGRPESIHDAAPIGRPE
jgi:hypothetical protein